MIRWLFISALVAITGFVVPAFGQIETSYDSHKKSAAKESKEPAEEKEALSAEDEAELKELMRLVNMESSETRYNASGTKSVSKIGLLSTRRGALEYPAFQLGMQAAAIESFGKPMNVAPAEAKTLADQARVLQRRGVETFLVDSPDPQKATEFFGHGKFLQREAALICGVFPKGMNPPLVLQSPLLYGERVGEEAIRFVGNVDVEVAYIMDDGDPNIEGFREKVMTTFERPFKNVAQKIKLVEVDPDKYEPGLVPPAVVCVLTSELSAKWAPKLRAKFPDSKIICVGEREETIKAFKDKLIDIRLHPDYQRILPNAMHESKQKSQMPMVLQPTMDKWW